MLLIKILRRWYPFAFAFLMVLVAPSQIFGGENWLDVTVGVFLLLGGINFALLGIQRWRLGKLHEDKDGS